MNNHIEELTAEIHSLRDKIDTKKNTLRFVEANSAIFTQALSCSFYATEITIWNPGSAIERIAKHWGQEGWLRVAEGKESINWERNIDGFNIVLRGMEKTAPTIVPLAAWPIMLES
jgi:hypothetical protein